MRRLITWGAGELGGRVARLWVEAGGPAIGLTKSDARHASLRAAGIEARQGTPVDLLREEDALLFAIPGHTNQQAAVELLLEHQSARPARAVFISVTGYFGAASGLISEESPQGSGERPASIARAEQTFRQWAGEGGVILRLGGLYSHERGPFAALARRGQVSRQQPPDKTMALIHYEDAAAATFAALRHPKPEPVYIAVTPPCPTRQEFYGLACQVLGLPEPDYEPPLDRPPVEYDVTRLRRDLLPVAAYPDWRMAIYD